MSSAVEAEVLALNQLLLDSIAKGDWASYEKLCDPSLTCFEPEALGQLVEGLPFHQYYFKFGGAAEPFLTTMCQAKVRIVGEIALLTYVRLNQRVTAAGAPTTSAVEETRVWQKKSDKWQHIHFHRSPVKV